MSIAGLPGESQAVATGKTYHLAGDSVTLASLQGNGGLGKTTDVLDAYTDRGDALEAGVPLSVSVGEANGDGLSPEGLETAFPVLLDSIAKRSEGDYVNLARECPGGFITGHCEDGHRFAKEVYCGREWCEVCNGEWEKGGKMKPSHARRFSRWYEKAQQIESMGVWTFTIPEGERWRYRTKEKLSQLGHAIQELLKSYGYSRGLRRWHWFGEKGEVFHPHLNCLVDGGRLDKKAVRAIRRAYSRLLRVELAIAEYHYVKTPGKKVHALKYVSRATFLDARWDVRMALELRGFRNQLWWGSKLWGGLAVWSLDDLPGERVAGMTDVEAKAVASLEKKECPLDGTAVVWDKFVSVREQPEEGVIPIGAGYYLWEGVSSPSRSIERADCLRKCRERAEAETALVLSELPPLWERTEDTPVTTGSREYNLGDALGDKAWAEARRDIALQKAKAEAGKDAGVLA